MYLRFLLQFLILSIGLLSGSLRAQTLSDVLGSIQERHVLLCKEYIFFDTTHPEIHPATNHTYTPNDPIQWTGLSEDNAYPTDNEVNALSMEGRITLLSQAVSEFLLLLPSYANIPSGESSDVGYLRPFSSTDFPDYPVISKDNYNEILRRLVVDLPKLRLAFAEYVAGYDFMITEEEPDYTEDGMSVEVIGSPTFSTSIRHIYPLLPEGVVGCDAWIYSQTAWEPWGDSVYEDGKFHFLGSWTPGDGVFALPSQSTFGQPNHTETLEDWHGYGYVYGGARSIVPLLKYTFAKGLDRAVVKEKVATLQKVRSTPAGAGAMSIHARKGVLCSMDIGSSLSDATSSALIGIEASPHGLQKKKFGESQFGGSLDATKGRFDYVSATLRFYGSEADYHVVYDASRTTASRPYVLPDWNPSTANNQGWSTGFSEYAENVLFSYWDSPRLRQVVGHDLVVDVPDAQSTPFKQVVNIYRMTTAMLATISDETVVLTPNTPIDVSSLPLIRTITLENPNAGTSGYGAGVEKLEIKDDQGTANPVTKLEIGVDLAGGYTSDWAADHKNWTYRMTDLKANTVAWEENWTYQTTSGQMVLKKNGTLTKTITGLPPAYAYNPARPLAEQAASLTTPAPNPKTVTFNNTATSLTVSTSDEPDVTTTWTNLGYGTDTKAARMITSVVKGPWKTTYSVDGDTIKAVSALNNANYATNWTDFNSLGQKVGIYSAPDGTVTDKGAGPVDSQNIEYGDGTGPSIWGMPMKITKKDGSGTLFTYEIFGDGGWSTQVDSGRIEEGVVTQGTSTYTALNGSGYLDNTDSVVIFSGSSLMTREILVSDNTPWGAPLEFWDTSTDLVTSRTYDGNLERLASSTDELGVETVFTDHDGLGRVTDFTWDEHAGTNTYSNSVVASTLLGTTSTTTTDGLDRAISGVSSGPRGIQSTDVTLGASSNSAHSQDSVTGIQSDLTNRVDGTIATATGTTLPFGGNEGSSLTVDSGLLKSSSNLQGLATASLTTWTDAWGRVRRTVAPSTAPEGTDTTEYNYSLPGSLLKRVITIEPSGRRLIEESEPYHSAGSITRSGVDKGEDGVLDTTDRYVESLANISEGKVVTTLKLNEDAGLREVTRNEWTPIGNITSTTTNGDEETITTTPDYTVSPKTITTTSSKGWTKTTTMTKLWQPEITTLSGTGIAGTTLNPDWRDDGSLAGVSYTIGGAEHTASFATDGKLSGLTDPLIEMTSVGQSFSGGKEILTVNGTTTTRALDGTTSEISGADVMSQGRETTAANGGFAEKITPATGSDTTRKYNAAGAKTLHDFNGNNDITSTWLAGGLLEKIHLARNGDIAFSYSPDGAKDLIGISYPTVSSGAFAEFYGTSVGFTPDTAGRVKAITDPSGSRSLGYEKGRLANTDYTSGALDEYTVVRHHDSSGRLDLITLKRNGQAIHAVGYTPNGDSEEISTVTSDNFSATLGRDAGRNITSVTRGSLVQTWSRPTAGRITGASSVYDGTNALIPPSTYLYDSKGRRTDCSIGGHSWNYRYDTTGQLHTTGNSRFSYSFDGIGRRSGNTGSLLNQFLVLSHENDPPKFLEVSADPAARVWIDGNEVQNFNGLATYAVTLPVGQSYGWVPWQTLAVLEGKGEGNPTDPHYNPLASPDAKSVQSGAVWVPPATEGFSYDADGNRESSTLWNYGWDGRNKLVRARTKNCTTAPEGESIAPQGYDVTFDYDAEGRRFKKNVISYQNGHKVSQDNITFVWDGWNIIYERHQLPSGLTTLERKYVWGPDIAGGVGGDTGAGGAGGLMLIRETRGTTTTDLYPLYDGSGHVLGLADNNGVLQAKYAYGPFGEQIVAQGPMAKSNPMRWATKYFDVETGLCYFGHRYYDPGTGQWLNREPLGENESLNLYQYCHGDPVNHVDVQGLGEAEVSGHIADAKASLAAIYSALASLNEGSEAEQMAGVDAIESLYGRYLGSITGAQQELGKFQNEGWFMSFRGVDEDLATQLGGFPLAVAGMKPGADVRSQLMASGSVVSDAFGSQSGVLDATHTGLVATEMTGSGILLATGVGGLGVATGKIIATQGVKAGGIFLAKQGAIAGGTIALGYGAQQGMIASGMAPEKAQMVMKGAELFFALRALKLARMVPTANPAGRPAVVLGEGMDSIKTAARGLRTEGIDAKWYQAWGKYYKPENFNLEKSLHRNERWLRSKINAGYDFYDIGVDATRARRSPFYELEQRILQECNITPIPLKRP